jgi:hypothetical protein
MVIFSTAGQNPIVLDHRPVTVDETTGHTLHSRERPVRIDYTFFCISLAHSEQHISYVHGTNFL